MESDSGQDDALWKGLAELGVFALAVPAENGGMGSDLLDLALVAEELGYAAAPGPFLGHAMATVALAAGAGDGSAEPTAAAWLERLASGEATATLALGEDDGVWSPDHLRAQVDAAGLQADKPLVPGADVADLLLVAAQCDGEPGLWLLERDAPGLSVDRLRGNDMTRRLDAVAIRDGAAVRAGGRRALERAIDAGLVLVAADAYGGARRCLDMTRQYALEREQFGQVIGAFQAVKHQLAEMAAALEPSLALCWFAAHAFDHVPEEGRRHAAMAKAHMADLFQRIARDAIELHGGIGFTWEFDLHLWFRRAIFDRAYLGDSAFHRARAADLAGW